MSYGLYIAPRVSTVKEMTATGGKRKNGGKIQKKVKDANGKVDSLKQST
jgi:hypothetical protein